MNLIEDAELEAKNKKTKTIMMIIIVCIILLLCISAVLIYMMHDIQKNMIKLTIDTKQISNFSEDMFIFEDDTVYISIKDFAKLVGYEAYSGDHTSEGTTKGYIHNSFEEASFTLNSNKLYKTLLTEKEDEYYNIEKPIKMQNEKLYMSLDGIQIATTSAISYDKNNNQFTVYTLPYLTTYYTTAIKDSAVGENNASFSNQKALLYNLVVVKNANNKYGVRKSDGTEIIGTKYASIKFIESTQEFIVTTDDRKMGILSSTGETKIQPNYDNIKQIDKDARIYLVKNDNKYGIVNENGNIVIHLEFDNIGINTSSFETNFETNNINSQQVYVLFDNCIPVQRDKKWGIYDKTGRQIIPIQYDELGCTSNNQSSINDNLLFLPEYEAIVVKTGNKYGLVSSTGTTIIPCVLDKFSISIEAGKVSYKMWQGETEVDVEAYLEQQGIQKVNPTDDEITVETSSDATVNETVNQNVTEEPEINAETNTMLNETLQITTNQIN